MKKNTALTKAGMTIYFSLAMVVLIPLFGGAILSAKVSAGRMQAANSVDQAMLSLFARYDRQLQKEYDLFFLNAGRDGSGAEIGSCIALLEEAADYGLKPNKGRAILGGKNLLRLERESTAVTAYTLVTDAGGIPFEAQAVQAMRQTGALDAVSLIREKLTIRKGVEAEGKQYLENASADGYGEIEEAAEEAQEADVEEAEESVETEEEEEVIVPEGFRNPLPVLYRLYRKKVMDLVVPDQGGISGRKIDRRSLVSQRSLASGMGMIDATGAADGMDNLYYIAWVISHFGHYAEPAEHCGLAYQMEYLLKGKYSDKENLTAVIRDLMKLRHAVNILCLYTDTEKSAELSSLALIIATVLCIPPAEPLIKAVLAVLWAYVESLVDVRALLEGKKVALVKSFDTWQTDPEDLAESGGDIKALTVDAPGGISYGEYLGTMIYVLERRKLTQRAMDMVESQVRSSGREGFRLNACIAAMGIEMKIRSEKKVTFPVEAELSYLDL